MQVTAVTRGHLLPFPLFPNMKRNLRFSILVGGTSGNVSSIQKKTATPLIDSGQFLWKRVHQCAAASSR